jgi:GR25 family glycosyltransferase involved in LPS biosynthesis
MVCSICKKDGHNKRTCLYKDRNINKNIDKNIDENINENINENTQCIYNIYIIAKNKEIFNEKIKLLNNKYNFIFIKASYLKKNNALLTKLNTRYNTNDNKIINKLGCISSHRNALLSIINNQTHNNIILEEDFILNNNIPDKIEKSCYLGGWIIPPKISNINKVKLNINLNIGINKIDYNTYCILMTHSYFIKYPDEAKNILLSTLQTEKIKNYDIHLKDNKLLKYLYYPPLFIQSKHISKIDNKNNNNHKKSINYGLL